MRPARSVIAAVLLLPAAFALTILGGYWLSPSTQHAANGPGWALAWKALGVAALAIAAWLVVDGVRRGRPLALAGRILLIAIALIAVWSARFESYGPTSLPSDQTYVWPFGSGPVAE